MVLDLAILRSHKAKLDLKLIQVEYIFNSLLIHQRQFSNIYKLPLNQMLVLIDMELQ